MTVPLPKFDERTAREIIAEVRSLLPATLGPAHRHGFDSALIQIFARFSELIIHRLNQAPEKNLLAFLDLLGVSQLPMQASRVPLTFSMAPGSATCAKVPAGTQVAAPPASGGQKPVFFETERDLVVTTARLDSLLIKFGARDQYKDLSSILVLPPDTQVAVAPAASLTAAIDLQSIPHLLYIAVPVGVSWPHIDQLRIRFVLEEGANPIADSRSLQWEICTHDDPPRAEASVSTPKPNPVPTATPKPLVVVPQEDGTRNLTQSGDVVFQNLPQLPPVAIEGVLGRWLGGRLLTPITGNAQPVPDMVRASQLPVVKQMTVEMQLARKELPLEQAFYNALKLDLTKDYFPFGERPKFGDTLYLANREAFSNPDAKITLHVQLTNPASEGPDVGIPNTIAHNTQLKWEFWNGEEWTELGQTGRYLRLGGGDGEGIDTEFSDETKSLSVDGDVSFRFSSAPAELNLNGQKNYWIRVRIAAGNYGHEPLFETDPATGRLAAKPATLAPPSIRSINLDYEVTKEAQPSAVFTCNDFAFAQAGSQISFKPFVPVAADDTSPSIYFGCVVDPPLAANPPASPGAPSQVESRHGKFPNEPVSAYAVMGHETSQRSGDLSTNLRVATWEYWGGAWRKCTVRDETQSLCRSGLIEFLPPQDFVTRKLFGRERYWVRMRSNATELDPTIRNIYLNTTTAIQGSSIANDILGTSDGKANQKFQTIQPMVLAGQRLEVCEPTLPPLHERRIIQQDEGDDSIQPVVEPTGRTPFWVTWHEVNNFYASGARDRHYVLDHVKGEVMFGDGTCGAIPPVLPGNIRMTSYRSGGGSDGNQPALAITKLASAVPYIQKVVNWIPARGGTDPEANAMLLERGPRGVRHGGRAVAREDFEDLAMLASREVARARCVPLYDLSVAPEARRPQPGLVSLIVVPNSTDARPQPDSDLLDRVRTFLDEWRLPTIEMIVTGVEYIRVDVDAEIVVDHAGDASDVERAVRENLDQYLHPVTGGPDGSGWDFGRLPQKYELYGLIEQISGVNHVRDLRVTAVPDRPGSEKTRHFLICCGQCRIALTLEEQSAVEFA